MDYVTKTLNTHEYKEESQKYKYVYLDTKR